MNHERVLQEQIAAWEELGARTLDAETRNLEDYLLKKGFPNQPEGYLNLSAFSFWGDHIIHDCQKRGGPIVDDPQKRFEAFVERENPSKKIRLFFCPTSLGFKLYITNTETRDAIVINRLSITLCADATERKPSGFFPDLEPIERYKAAKNILLCVRHHFETDESRERVARTNEEIAQRLAESRR